MGNVLVGNKPIMMYVLYALEQRRNGDETIIFKARGQRISKAVVIAQLSVQKMSDFEVGEIITGSIDVPRSEREMRKEGGYHTTKMISTIEITIKKV